LAIKRLIWLSSYPKSGNTWVRAVLQCCLPPRDPLDINEIDMPGASCRNLLDHCLGIETEQWANDQELTPILKNHSVFTTLEEGCPVFPPECSRGAVHIVRDPRDVAVSFASHRGTSIDKAIDRLHDPRFCFAASPIPRKQIPQPLLTWSGHFLSWKRAPMPVLQIRYEDMSEYPLVAFRQIVDFCGLGIEDSDSFFRKGVAGAWREAITKTRARRIENDHGPVREERIHPFRRLNEHAAVLHGE
jgi:aryl sulfotransferase